MKKKILTWIMASVFSATSVPLVYAAPPIPVVNHATENQYEALIEQWFDETNRSIQDVVSFIEALLYSESYLNYIANYLQGKGGSDSESYQDAHGNQWKGTASLTGSPNAKPREFKLTIHKNQQSEQYITKWTKQELLTVSGVDPVYSVALHPVKPVPIDGGASLLLAAGAAYGLKRLRRRKEQQ